MCGPTQDTWLNHIKGLMLSTIMFSSLSYLLDFKFCDQILKFIYFFIVFLVLKTVGITFLNTLINLLKHLFRVLEVNMWSQIQTASERKRIWFLIKVNIWIFLHVTWSHIFEYRLKFTALFKFRHNLCLEYRFINRRLKKLYFYLFTHKIKFFKKKYPHKDYQ